MIAAKSLSRRSAFSVLVSVLPISVIIGNHVGDLDGQARDRCTPLRQVRSVYLEPNGTTSQLPAADSARQTEFRTKEGQVVVSITPPPKFLATRATAATLKTFGIPQRPLRGTEAQSWLRTWGHVLRSDPNPGRMCEHQKVNTSVQNDNWAGRVDQSGGFTNITGTFRVPTFYAACAHNSSHAIWNGIGGVSGSFLIQAGVDNPQTSVNAVYPFFEVLPAGEVQVISPSISPGNSVNVTTSYSTSDSIATWTINNVSTGVAASYRQSTRNYDSTSVEWIDERPQDRSLQYYVDVHYYYYRKADPTQWSVMYANGEPAGYWASAAYYMYSNSRSRTLVSRE